MGSLRETTCSKQTHGGRLGTPYLQIWVCIKGMMSVQIHKIQVSFWIISSIPVVSPSEVRNIAGAVQMFPRQSLPLNLQAFV